MRPDRESRRGRLAEPQSVVIELLERRLCLAAVSFMPAAMYNAPGARALAVGDFNGDGWPDLAVTNGDSVSIWLNQQNGTFALGHTYSIPGADAIAVGDFNRDGALDLAVTGKPLGEPSVNILFGNGDGTFLSTPETYGVAFGSGFNLPSLAVADFNGDGAPDLALAQSGVFAQSGQGQVIVLLNQGDGSFGAPAYYPVGHLTDGVSSANAIMVGDFNQDHVFDLAVAVSQQQYTSDVPGYVSVLYGNTRPDPNDPRSTIGDGTFSQSFNFAAGTNPIALTTADFNGDGYPDVAVANSGDAISPGNVSVLLNDAGLGHLLPGGTLTAGDSPHSIVSADFNGDGTSDLAVAGASGVLVKAGRGDGTFALSQMFQAGGTGLGAMVVGDFNRDGQPDLAVVTSTGFSVLLNNTKPTVMPTVTAASYDYTHSPHSLSFTFNENVTAGAGALQVQNLTSGLPVTPAGYSFDGNTHSATFTFAGALSTGDYRAMLLASGVTDAAGVHPAADYQFNFFFLVGDVNHDGKVDFSDLVILARHFGQSGAAYSDGDLDYDGKVDFNDLVILSRHYGESVPTAAALTPAVGDDVLTLPLKRRRR